MSFAGLGRSGLSGLEHLGNDCPPKFLLAQPKTQMLDRSLTFELIRANVEVESKVARLVE
jgi:hypothetical protein